MRNWRLPETIEISQNYACLSKKNEKKEKKTISIFYAA